MNGCAGCPPVEVGLKGGYAIEAGRGEAGPLWLSVVLMNASPRHRVQLLGGPYSAESARTASPARVSRAQTCGCVCTGPFVRGASGGRCGGVHNPSALATPKGVSLAWTPPLPRSTAAAARRADGVRHNGKAGRGMCRKRRVGYRAVHPVSSAMSRELRGG